MRYKLFLGKNVCHNMLEKTRRSITLQSSMRIAPSSSIVMGSPTDDSSLVRLTASSRDEPSSGAGLFFGFDSSVSPSNGLLPFSLISILGLTPSPLTVTPFRIGIEVSASAEARDFLGFLGIDAPSLASSALTGFSSVSSDLDRISV